MVIETNTTNRLDSVQLMRFFAGLLVVLAHAESRIARTFPQVNDILQPLDPKLLPNWGDAVQVGVHIFFLISGFIMLYSASNQFAQTKAQKTFFVKRLIRIVPIYWILTTLSVFILAIRPDLFTYRQTLDVSWIVASYLFIPWTSVDLVDSPVIGLGWTLNFEMYFYVIFAVSMFMNRQNALRFMALFFLLSVCVSLIHAPNLPLLIQVTNPILLEFLLGVFLAYYYLKGNSTDRYISRFTGVLGFSILIPVIVFLRPETELLRFLLWGPASALILFSMLHVLREPMIKPLKVLVALGNASYSIYLIQVFTLPAFSLVFKYIEPSVELGFITMLVVSTSLTLLVGYIFFVLVERPITQTLRRFI
ncbi:MAG: acyltransferase family protein [Dehalococcoidia bacterium]